jgi:hypothetical protein
MVGIVGASGVLQAIPTILSMLPRDFPAPILVVVAICFGRCLINRKRWLPETETG